jgi:hypothetical protein
MPTIRCIFCDNVYDSARTRGRCSDCGFEHPPGTVARAPDVFHTTVVTPSGRPVRLSDEEVQARQQASAALMTVAVVNLLCRGFGLAAVLLAMQQAQQAPQGQPALQQVTDAQLAFLGVFLGISAVFFLLSWWARYQPLPPSLIGLMLYAVLFTLECVLSWGGCFGFLIHMIIFSGLIRAVQVSMKAQARRPEF